MVPCEEALCFDSLLVLGAKQGILPDFTFPQPGQVYAHGMHVPFMRL
jgi:hypothetical protein